MVSLTTRTDRPKRFVEGVRRPRRRFDDGSEFGCRPDEQSSLVATTRLLAGAGIGLVGRHAAGERGTARSSRRLERLGRSRREPRQLVRGDCGRVRDVGSDGTEPVEAPANLTWRLDVEFTDGHRAVSGHDVGPERVADIADAVDIPVVGIGGIDADNAGAVVEAGADGVAVITAVTRADDPEAATRALGETVESARD